MSLPGCFLAQTKISHTLLWQWGTVFVVLSVSAHMMPQCVPSSIGDALALGYHFSVKGRESESK